MERLELTPEQQALVDNWREELNIQPNDIVQEGTNLVVDDHLQVDNSWKVVVLGGASGCVASYVPEWGDFWIPIDLVDYVTDRAGPNGQTMPIFDEQLLAARAAVANPQKAAPPKHPKPRRSFAQVLRDAVQRKLHAEHDHIMSALRKHGALGKDHG